MCIYSINVYDAQYESKDQCLSLLSPIIDSSIVWPSFFIKSIYPLQSTIQYVTVYAIIDFSVPCRT